MSTVGTFCLIKNEIQWIRAHLLSWLPFVDQMTFFDGNSTDGTLEILKDVQKHHPFGNRITIFEDKDPVNLREDYERLSNDCLHSLHTDYAIFAHPDMILDSPGGIANMSGLAYFTNLRSFAGEPGGELFEIIGRGERWFNVYRLRNPDLGLHYHGTYGHSTEGCYFSEITGKKYEPITGDFSYYPFKVLDSGIKILHYSDVRTYERRLERMERCLVNQGHGMLKAAELAPLHPRVSLKDGQGLRFIPAEYHELLKEPQCAS